MFSAEDAKKLREFVKNLFRFTAEGKKEPAAEARTKPAAAGKESVKKGIQNLAIIGGVGVLMLIVSGLIGWDDVKKISSTNVDEKKVVATSGYLDEYDQVLENKIKNILSEISGVGKVSVAITYASSKEIVPAQDTKQNESSTDEKDKEGGVRNTSQVDTDNKVILSSQSESQPVVLKELPPEVKGVVVVADGAKDEITKVNIGKAVSTALGIPLSRIQVFARAVN